MDVNSTEQLSSFRDAWRAVTWSRKVSSSSNYWRQTCAAQVADIKGQELTFRDLYSAFPILSVEDGDDILYLRSLVEPSHQDGWVAAVDIGNKALKAIGNYYLSDDFYYRWSYDPEHPFRASTLSRHLDMTPGNQVSACRKQTEAERSANRPSRTSTRVSSCERRAKIRRLLELAGRTKRAQNSPGNITQNHRISQVRPIEINLAPQASFNNFNGPASFHVIHNNFLPLTHLPMAHTQAMSTTNSSGGSFPLLWSCLLLVRPGSIHLLQVPVQLQPTTREVKKLLKT